MCTQHIYGAIKENTTIFKKTDALAVIQEKKSSQRPFVTETDS